MSKSNIYTGGILLLSFLMTACNSYKSADKLSRELDSILVKEFRADEPGGSVLVKKGHVTVFLRSYGLADLEHKGKDHRQHTVQSWFCIKDICLKRHTDFKGKRDCYH